MTLLDAILLLADPDTDGSVTLTADQLQRLARVRVPEASSPTAPAALAAIEEDPTVQDLMRHYGAALGTIHGWNAAGQFPGSYRDTAGRWRFPASALEARQAWLRAGKRGIAADYLPGGAPTGDGAVQAVRAAHAPVASPERRPREVRRRGQASVEDLRRTFELRRQRGR
jgi:hypothetical protein